MSLHIQRYSPDTCGCVLLETWDDTDDPAARVHTFKAMEVICPAHTAHAGVALYERIREENRRKNLVWTMIQGLDPTCDHATYGWQFDAERCLLVTLPSLTPAQRLQLQGGADLQFGPDRIHVL